MGMRKLTSLRQGDNCYMESKHPLLEAFANVVKSLGISEPKLEKRASNEKYSDPLEELKVTLDYFKNSLSELNSAKNSLATKTGKNFDEPQGEIESTKERKEALALFQKELKSWEGELVELMKNNPEIATAFDKADLTNAAKTKKKKVRKKRSSGKNKWLSA